MSVLDRLLNLVPGFGNAAEDSGEDHLDYDNPEILAAETAVIKPKDYAEGEEEVTAGVSSEIRPPVDYPIPTGDDDEPHFV